MPHKPIKTLLFLSVFCLINSLNFQLFAQKPIFKWGKVYENSSLFSGGNRLIGFTKDKYFTYGTIKHGWWIFGNKGPAITQYNNNHEQVNLREFSLKKGNEKLHLSGDFLYLNNEIFVFASKYISSQDRQIIYKKRISENLSNEGVWEEFDNISSKSLNRSGSFDFVRSEDENKIMLYRNNPINKNANKESVTYKLYDNKLKLLWEKRLDFDVDDKKYDIQGYSLTNDGQFILLGRRDLTRKEKERKMPSYKYLLYLYDNKKDQLEDYEIALGKMYISDISYTIDNNEKKLIVAGFYSNKGPGFITGTFYQRIDIETKKVDIEQTKEFEKDFLMDHMSEKSADKNKELISYDIRQLVKRNDGGLTIVAEQYYISTSNTISTVNGRTTSTTNYHYHFNDIIVVNINGNGKIGWALTIPKTQYSTNDGGYYSSFAFFVSGDKMYFVYYDNPLNYNLNTNKRSNKRLKIEVNNMPVVNKAVIGLATVDYEGYLTREVLQKSNKELKVKKGAPVFIPKLTSNMDDKLLVRAFYRKKYKLGFLLFDSNSKKSEE